MVLLLHMLKPRSLPWLHSAGSLPKARMSMAVSHPLLFFFSHVAPHHSVVQPEFMAWWRGPNTEYTKGPNPHVQMLIHLACICLLMSHRLKQVIGLSPEPVWKGTGQGPECRRHALGITNVTVEP